MKTRVSKFLSYLLRHSDIEMDGKVWVDLDLLLSRVQERYPVDEEFIRELVEEEPKGRYQIKENKIRATYGHSRDVEISHPTETPKRLFHGTTPDKAEKILHDGLKPMSRKKVHLSNSEEDAIKVGSRRTPNPVILEIDAKKANKEGIKIEKATEKIYLSDFIPAEFISRKLT